jgi:hypothetical protein
VSESKYRETLVTFLDVMGFQQMVKASENDSSQVIQIRNNLNALRERFAKGQNFRRETRSSESPVPIFRAFSFSDLTVRATVIDPIEELVYVLANELHTVVNMQCELALRDDGHSPILIRGAISLGRAEVHPENPSDELIFGPALVRSYELESIAAIFPRIVIDPEVIRRASVLGNPVFPKYLITLGEDGVYFVDYLRACEEFCWKPSLVFAGWSLATHKTMIETQLAKLKKDGAKESILQKYLWLVNYHNSTITRLFPEPSDIKFTHADDPSAEIMPAPNPQELYISEEMLDLLKH